MIDFKVIYMGKYFLFLFFYLIFMSKSYSGVIFSGTRFVLNEKDNDLSITIRNKEGARFLIKSNIENDSDENSNGEFGLISTPPLFTINGNSEQKIKIIKYGHDSTKSNEERLFRLNVSVIPFSEKDSSLSNIVQIGIKYHFNIFYRSNRLNADNSSDFQRYKLKFMRESEGLGILNESNYHIAIAELKVNGNKSEKSYLLKPHQKIVSEQCKRQEKFCIVKWKYLDDIGTLSSEITDYVQ